MISRTWIVIILIIAIGAGAVAWLYLSKDVAAAAEEKDLITVQRVDFPVNITAPGILEAAKSVSIGAPKIRDMHRFRLARLVEEGKHVSEGDFLLEIDGSDIGRQLRDETASYQRVLEEYQKKRSDFDIQMRDLKLQLEQAKSDYDKLDNKLNRQADLESAIVIEETKIRKESAKKQVELLERKILAMTESGRLDLQISRSNENHYKRHMEDLMDAMDSLTVTAPVAGVVILKRDWNNQPRQIGSNIDPFNPVMELPDLSTLRAKVNVDEVDAGKAKLGQEAIIQVDAIQGKIFKGKVAYLSAILKQPAFDRPQKAVETWIEIQDADVNTMRPWMSVRAQIQVGQYPKVVVIPLASIQERDGRSFVQVWRPEKKDYESREVQLLTNDGISAVIQSGLEADERIRSKPKA